MVTKRLTILIMLVYLSFSIQLNVPNQIYLSQSYQLTASDGEGNVYYSVRNLPTGLSLNNGKIDFLYKAQVPNGNYPITIIAQDSSGAADKKNVVLTVGNSV